MNTGVHTGLTTVLIVQYRSRVSMVRMSPHRRIPRDHCLCVQYNVSDYNVTEMILSV